MNLAELWEKIFVEDDEDARYLPDLERIIQNLQFGPTGSQNLQFGPTGSQNLQFGPGEELAQAKLLWCLLVIQTSMVESHSPETYTQMEKYALQLQTEKSLPAYERVIVQLLVELYRRIHVDYAKLIIYSKLCSQHYPKVAKFHSYRALGHEFVAERTVDDENTRKMVKHYLKAIELGQDAYAMASLICYYRNVHDYSEARRYLEMTLATKEESIIVWIAKNHLSWKSFAEVEEICQAGIRLGIDKCSSLLRKCYSGIFNYSGFDEVKLNAIAYAFHHPDSALFSSAVSYVTRPSVDLQYWLMIPASYFSEEHQQIRLAHAQSLMLSIPKDPQSHFYQYRIRDVERIIEDFLRT